VAISGIFIIASIGPEASERVAAIQSEFDPKLANSAPPHVTIAGSSGVGPIPSTTTPDEIRAALEPITSTTPPLLLPFGAPIRFMQTTIIVLPLDPHGPLRTLHERIASSGLKFERPRFAFTPHCTLSFYPTHPSETLRKLLAVRYPPTALIDRISIQLTSVPQPSRTLLELQLTGAREGDPLVRSEVRSAGRRSSHAEGGD
jgi:2'-5' RNA ligase